jgi:hypothetical protein
MKITEAHAGQPIGTNQPAAVVHFDLGYYWEIPASRHDAVKIADLANDLAGEELDAISTVGDKVIAALTVGGDVVILAGAA